MLSDIKIKKKFEILSNKLHAGRFDEVIEEATILLKKNKHQVFFNILSLAYQSKGDFLQSENTLNEALRLDPNNPYFLNNMGTTQYRMENYEKAEEFFLKGLKIVPNYINILNNLGNLKRDLNQNEEALNYYKKSLSINPNIVETLFNISIFYQSTGNFDDAKKNLFKLLKINPKFTSADRLISYMTKYKIGDVHLNEMLEKSKKLQLNENQMANLFFSIGKAYEDLKEFDNSFDNYNKGNNLLKKISNFEIKNEKDNFENIKKLYLDNFKKINLDNTKKIIFIVGMPRSGTSLIEQILSSHKNVYGGGELVFLKKIMDEKFFNKNFINELGSNNSFSNLLEQSYEEYVKKISLINSSDNVFIDKAPLNFKYIGFIKKIFSNSKIIHCKRNSLDVCWSNFKNFFGASLPFTNDLDDLANYYNIYEDLMKFWQNELPNEIYNMNYNDLIYSPEDEIKKLLKFCELSWDPNCMKHENNTKTIKTASASQARLPINKTGLKTYEPFKKYLKKLSDTLKN